MPAVVTLGIIRRFVDSVAQTDPDPLGRFVASRDEDSFAVLVRQHAALVFDVCRGVLGNDADAEDALQATFLVLARNASSVRRRGSLAAWLHGVALRIARKARSAAVRRRTHEQRRSPHEPAPPRDEVSWAEVRRVLHEELSALPAAYRSPLVLCYLQGVPHDRAATDLGLSKSALKKRLERGRDKLRVALVRRGLGPAALLAVARVPTASAASMVPVAVRAAVGGVVSPRVLSLASGGVTMIMTKWTAALSLVTATVLTAALAANPQARTERPASTPAATAEAPRHPDWNWISGEWKVKSITMDGVELKGDDVKDSCVTFKDGKFEPMGPALTGLAPGVFCLTPTEAPKSFDLTFTEGGRKKDRVEGIYHFNPNEARIALRVSNEALGRPRGFHSSKGTGIVTLILEPVEKKGPPPRPVSPPAPSGAGTERKVEKALAVPAKTPFDNDIKKRFDYIQAYRHGHAWASGDKTAPSMNPQDDNLHAIRGWVEGWQAGVKVGGTGDLPAKYAPFLVWRE